MSDSESSGLLDLYNLEKIRDLAKFHVREIVPPWPLRQPAIKARRAATGVFKRITCRVAWESETPSNEYTLLDAELAAHRIFRMTNDSIEAEARARDVIRKLSANSVVAVTTLLSQKLVALILVQHYPIRRLILTGRTTDIALISELVNQLFTTLGKVWKRAPLKKVIKAQKKSNAMAPYGFRRRMKHGFTQWKIIRSIS